jgi:hypothetical protein
LIPQNHGAGFGLCFITIRIPVGKPQPINSPAGAMIATAVTARARMELLSMAASGGEGINQAHLNEIEALLRARKPTARFVYVKMDTRQLGK